MPRDHIQASERQLGRINLKNVSLTNDASISGKTFQDSNNGRKLRYLHSFLLQIGRTFQGLSPSMGRIWSL